MLTLQKNTMNNFLDRIPLSIVYIMSVMSAFVDWIATSEVTSVFMFITGGVAMILAVRKLFITVCKDIMKGNARYVFWKEKRRLKGVF